VQMEEGMSVLLDTLSVYEDQNDEHLETGPWRR
jgi:hypothetical protein